MSHQLLSIITFLPTVAAIIMALFLRGDDAPARNNARWLAMFATLATFVASLFLLFGFDPSNTGFQFVEEREWVLGFTYKMGVDGLSVLFVLLTTFLMPIVIWSAWRVEVRVKEYMISMLILETLMIGVFTTLDLFLFYLFFEGGLIPMFIIIGVWGGPNRIYATFKFFLYTFLGSILMFVAMMAMYSDAGTSDIVQLMNHGFSSEPIRLLGFSVIGGAQTLMFLAFLASFAVKLPMWPAHTWLPDAHVEAPTGGSVVLAAILLKLGGYGMLRFLLPMFPVASEYLTPLMMWLGAIAIIYTALVAMVQTDMKKLIAYTSVAHMGYVTVGIFSANQQGVDGAIFQMLSHGFISGALFLIIGVLYDRMHTREIAAYGGLVNRMPRYALVFMFFTMANLGLPGTSGFVGEFLTVMGSFQVNTGVALVTAAGMIFSACYALWLYRQLVFGEMIKQSLMNIKDMSVREKAFFTPLVAMTLILGFYPSLITDITGPTVDAYVSSYQAKLSGTSAAAAIATE